VAAKSEKRKSSDSSAGASVLSAFDECVSRYMSERLKLVDDFAAGHFSLDETVALQRKSWMQDLLANPLNALWSIPYLGIKKTAELLDKTDWEKHTHPFSKVPSGLKTRYQLEVETIILSELLPVENLVAQIKADRDLCEAMAARNIKLDDLRLEAVFKKHVSKYSAHQATISDVVSTLLTFFIGWAFFGDRSISVMGMGDRIAHKFARDRAASDFFLGKEIGSGFYSLFPPQPTGFQIAMATVAVGFLLTFVSLFASVMSDPLRKKLGMHRRKLRSLCEDLEDDLVIVLRKTLRERK
jgi:hypothetical protein